MATLFLVSCVAEKTTEPSNARELYISPWFVAARSAVEATGEPWYILSAKHGLLHPDTVTAPYDSCLDWMPVEERRDWGERVSQKLRAVPGTFERVVVLTTPRYREFLMETLHELASEVATPLDGMSEEKQIALLLKQGV